MSGVKTNQTADHRLQSHSSEWHKERPFWLIGNPDNRRTKGLQQARLQCGLSPAEVLPYVDLLKTWRQGGSLADLVNQSLQRKVTAEAAPLIRIDAPGSNGMWSGNCYLLVRRMGNPTLNHSAESHLRQRRHLSCGRIGGVSMHLPSGLMAGKAV